MYGRGSNIYSRNKQHLTNQGYRFSSSSFKPEGLLRVLIGLEGYLFIYLFLSERLTLLLEEQLNHVIGLHKPLP